MPDAVERRETGSDRSGAGAADPSLRAAPSLAILGADALVAAQPATAVQLAHACLRVGYQAVVPATWGDELVAGGCLEHVASRRTAGDRGPTIFCGCPYVAHRLLAVGRDLEPFIASFVAPPVAAAQYLRALYAPTRLRLTYIGRCPGAAHDTIDARLTPDELLTMLGERGIDPATQPRVFDSVIPPDRRRFFSQPGGLPSAEALRRVDPERHLVEVTSSELAAELAQQLLSKASVLIDVAARVGCACAGAVGGSSADGSRGRVTALEPPRASSPIVDDRVAVEIELPLPPAVRHPAEVMPSVGERRTSGASRAVTPPEAVPAPGTAPSTEPADVPRRRSPTGGITVRQPPGAVPTTRSGEGRALPRAYVARRGTGARGRGPGTPPRGEPAQRLDASGADGGRSTNGGASSRGGGSDAPPPERGGRAEHERGGRAAERLPARPSDRPEMRGPHTASSASAPSGDARAHSGPPDHATDAHRDPLAVPGERAATEAVRAEPAPAPTPVAEPGESSPVPSDGRGPSPISGPTSARVASFRVRSAALARMAVGAARQRRTTVAALLAVALLSATVGVLAGRWLAARAESPAAGVAR